MKKFLAVLILIFVLPLASSDWKYQTKEKVYDFRILDYNGDGKEEIAVGSEFLYIVDFEGNLLKKFEYPGYAFDFSKVYLVNSFAVGGKDRGYLIDYLGNLKFEYPLDNDVQFALIRDVDSDSRKEVIFVTVNKIYLLYRNGNLKHIRDDIPGIKKIECIDIDGNGDLEFIVAADKFYVLDRDLNTIWYCCDEPNSFLVNDFNGDGTEEIVLAGENLLYYKQNGLLYWKKPLIEEAVDIFLGDYDSDGINEIMVFGSSTISAYDKEGTKKWGFEYPSYKNLNAAHIDDLDGDDINEVILGIGNHVIVLENEKKVGEYSTTYSGDEIFKIRTKDIDIDGKKEILVSSWRFLNVFTYAKQIPEEKEEEEEEEEEKIDVEAKKTQADELYRDGGGLFNSKNYTESKAKFTQAKSLYEEIGDTEKANVCDQFISKAYRGINGDNYFSDAQTKEEEEDYEGAIKSYGLAKEFYSEINQEKAYLCTQKITELEGKTKFPEIPEIVPIAIFIAAIAAVIGYAVRMVMKKR